MFAEQENRNVKEIGRIFGYVTNLFLLSLIFFLVLSRGGKTLKSFSYINIVLIILITSLLGKMLRKYLNF